MTITAFATILSSLKHNCTGPYYASQSATRLRPGHGHIPLSWPFLDRVIGLLGPPFDAHDYFSLGPSRALQGLGLRHFVTPVTPSPDPCFYLMLPPERPSQSHIAPSLIRN
jgi:hypothetical protein